MYGLKQVYKLGKKMPFYKCKDLMNNAKFALVLDEETGNSKVFTTLKRKNAKKEVIEFLKSASQKQMGLQYEKYFIILDNI